MPKRLETNFIVIIHTFFDFGANAGAHTQPAPFYVRSTTFIVNPIQVHLIMQFISILFYFQRNAAVRLRSSRVLSLY